MELLYEPIIEPEDTKPKPSEEQVTDLKNQVAAWLSLDDQINKLSIAIRERKVAKVALANKIEEFMFKYGYDSINSELGIVKAVVRNVKTKPKLKDIKEKLNEWENGEELIKDLESKCNTTEKRSIRRVVQKISMQI